MLEGSEKVPEF